MKTFAISAFSPPVHGFSLVSDRFVDEMVERGCDVYKINRSPNLYYGKRLRYLEPIFYICAIFKSLVMGFFYRPSTVYLGLSGGVGLFVDILSVLVLWPWVRRFYFHHHNYTYINDKSFLMSVVVWLFPGAIHILLCEKMAVDFADKYSVQDRQCVCLSNVAFSIRKSDVTFDVERGDGSPEMGKNSLRLGFLSNVTREKGVFEFVSIVSRLHQMGVAVHGYVAGPIAPELVDELVASCGDGGMFTFVGALYGDVKYRFLSEIDLLVFPSKYKNEAEPLTVSEALSCGTPVVSTARGCCATLKKENGVLVGPVDSNEFVEFATSKIYDVSQGIISLGGLRIAAMKGYSEQLRISRICLDSLLFDIANGILP